MGLSFSRCYKSLEVLIHQIRVYRRWRSNKANRFIYRRLENDTSVLYRKLVNNILKWEYANLIWRMVESQSKF